eukprot:CAMPEP_0196577590 /NCGR_PEP_ID=MMETSP1081-20130531/6636_1 /TAXON_ID=36882 /ORGANISM="Pyramimonas amylifera, Strain CCMP720" /LENGTH=75 /DNA_ID=CAMNT_0041896555 /DNA_START=334 /DNA_END=558 /DNA_ORIENTATION=+
MARWGDPNSATSEFFINLGDNAHLDKTGDTEWSLGFTVWGQVVDGLDIAEQISTHSTKEVGGLKMLLQPVPFNAG